MKNNTIYPASRWSDIKGAVAINNAQTFCACDIIAKTYKLNTYILLLVSRRFVHGNFAIMHTVTRQFPRVY